MDSVRPDTRERAEAGKESRVGALEGIVQRTTRANCAAVKARIES